MNWRRCIRRLAAHRGGAAAIEAAFVLPAMAIIVIGIMETGRAMWIQNTLQYAVDETARMVMRETTTYTDAELETAVKNAAAGLDSDAVAVAVTNETVNGADFRTVTASVTHNWLIPLPLDNITLQARGRIPQ